MINEDKKVRFPEDNMPWKPIPIPDDDPRIEQLIERLNKTKIK
jgi:hypothetical protein